MRTDPQSSVRLMVASGLALTAAASLAAQESRSPLRAPQAVLPIDSAPFQRLLDYDGDGDLDAVGTRVDMTGAQCEVFVWRNDNGGYTEVYRSLLPTAAHFGGTPPTTLAVAVGDFDADGRDDFVVSGGIGTVKFSSQPGATWSQAVYPVAGVARTHGAAAGDFDGDGVDDFAIAIPLLVGVQIDVHLATGAVLSTAVSNGGDPPLLYAADFDGDGKKELLATVGGTIGAGRATVVKLVGGQLAVTQTLDAGFGGATHWMTGDVDGDGDQDAVVFGTLGTSSYRIVRNTGGTLVVEGFHTGGPAEYLVDVDGDGDLDGVCCGGGGGGVPWPLLNFASTFEVALNDGTGFAPAFQFPGAGSLSMAGAADIDGDGDIDFVAGRCVFYGRGPWTEVPTPVLPVAANGGPLAYAASMSNCVPLARDFDGDGDPDLCAPGRFWINRGDGQTTAVSPLTLLPPPPAGRAFGAPVWCDFDGDGVRDLVVPQGFLFTTDALVGMRHNGAGHFDSVGALTPLLSINTAQLANLVAADLDGDGDEDLIAGTATIFWNQGGTFVPGNGAEPLQRARIHGIADFDGDGIDDLLSEAGIDRGTGDHTTPFVAAMPLVLDPIGLHTNFVADLNGDGKPDIVSGGSLATTNNAYQFYVNTTPPGGPLSFAPPVTMPFLHYYGSGFSVGDFDGDGRTDILFTDIAEGAAIALLAQRITDNPLPQVADFDLVRVVADGVMADVDGDGDMDVVGDHLVRNWQFHGASAGWRIQDIGGSVGEGGSTPRLSASGPFRVGLTETVLLRGVPGPSLAVFGYSGATANLPDFPFVGTTLLVDPNTINLMDIALPLPGLGRGAGHVELPVYLPPHIAGFTLYSQAYVWDPTAPASVTCSNRVAQTIGF